MKRTIQSWCKNLGFEIMSYDGFRKTGMDEEITEDEFRCGLVYCTQNMNSVGWKLVRTEAALEQSRKKNDELERKVAELEFALQDAARDFNRQDRMIKELREKKK